MDDIIKTLCAHGFLLFIIAACVIGIPLWIVIAAIAGNG